QTSIYSPPFYSSVTGYKMRARLYLNGDGNARRTHVSLFFVLMRGPNDAILKFPFSYKVTFCLHDQTPTQRHIIDSFRPDIKSNSFQRPRSEMNIASGIPKFLPLTMIQQEGNPYIRDDTMFIKVIVDFDGMSKALLSYALNLNPGFPMHIQQLMIKQETERKTQQQPQQTPTLPANHDNASNEPQSDNEPTDESFDEGEWVDLDHDEEIVDNFIEGVNTEEILLDDLQKQGKKVIDITRKTVNTTKQTSTLSAFVEKQRINYNLKVSKDKRIRRRLSKDVKTRWNSSFKMLSMIDLYRDIITDMFKCKGNIGITSKQRKKLAHLELTTDQWDLIKLLIALLKPFYSATKALSTTQHPTVGSALYLIRSLEEYLEKFEDNLTLNALKAKVLVKFQYYMFDDTDQFNTLKMYGYFDPMGFSILTKLEQTSVEKELIKIYKKNFESTAPLSPTSSGSQHTTSRANNINKAWEAFLKSTNRELQQEVSTTSSIHDEFKRYRNLATKLYV
ncbi:unnamed protein product, partial [Rotaria sp. Silwood2]